jgi:hypothetical protein
MIYIVSITIFKLIYVSKTIMVIAMKVAKTKEKEKGFRDAVVYNRSTRKMCSDASNSDNPLIDHPGRNENDPGSP